MHPSPLSETKRQLLAQWLRTQERAARVTPQTPIRAEPVLSFNQQGLLLLELSQSRPLRPASTHHAALCCRLHGQVDASLLESALNTVLRRHDVCRTAILPRAALNLSELSRHPSRLMDRTLFTSVVNKDSAISLSIHDLQYSNPDQVETVAATIFHPPFSYDRPPLVRAGLLRLSPIEHFLVVAFPHAITDGASLGILERELTDCYRSGVTDTDWALPEPTVRYADFAREQWDTFENGGFDAGLGYWMQRWSEYEFAQLALDNLSAQLKVAPRPATSNGPQALHLDCDTYQAVKACARRCSATPYVWFLAAWFVLLHVRSRKPRLAIWGHFANRIQPRTPNLFGYVANHHLLGVDIEPDDTVERFVKRVRQVVVDAITHQEVPLPLVWAAFGSKYGRPLRIFSDVCVVMDFLMDEPPHTAGDLVFERTELPVSRRDSRLKLVIRDGGSVADVIVQYSESRFSPTQIDKLLHDLDRTLTWMVHKPESCLSECPAG